MDIDKLINICIKLGEYSDYSIYSNITDDAKRKLKQMFDNGRGIDKKDTNKKDDYSDIIKDSNVELYSVFNKGRDSIASKFAQIAIFTTIKDERRCEVCKSKQGKRFKVGTNEYNENMPPLHNRCRCIYTYIMGRNY